MAICEAMIVMAHKLGMTVIAEGIENPRTTRSADRRRLRVLARDICSPDPCRLNRFGRLLHPA